MQQQQNPQTKQTKNLMKTKPKSDLNKTPTWQPQTNQNSGIPEQSTHHGSENGYSRELVKLQHSSQKKNIRVM